MKFRSGHSALRRRVDASDLGTFKIDGVYCRLIPLTKGLWAIVDEADYKWLSAWKWFASFSTQTKTHYAQRRYRREDGSWGTVTMHGAILGTSKKSSRTPDHIDTKGTLDNRRDNLRGATKSQQKMNQRRYKNNTTGYKGVSEASDGNAFIARIQKDGVSYYLGRFNTPKRAHMAYCKAAKRLFGKFARMA